MKVNFILAFILSGYSLSMNAQLVNADSLKQLLVSAKEDKSRVDLLSNLARYYMFFNPDTAEGYGKQGIELARKINYEPGEAGCMLSLCISLTFLGNYTDALDYGLRASPLLAELHDTTLLIWNNIQIATCYRQLEDYDQALIYGNNAKKFFRSFHADSNQVSVALGIIGSVYEKKNQPDSALYYEQKAFALDTTWSQIFQFIGQVYAKTGELDMALDYYKRGLSNAVKGNNSVTIIDLCNNLSKVFELRGQTDSMLLYAGKAFQLSRKKINPEGLLDISNQLARIYEIRGKPDSTIKYLKIATGLKDSLYSRKKTREVQNFEFKEKLHQQDLFAQHQRDTSRIKIAVLFALILIFLLIVFFFWRSNQQKQKANLVLQKTLSELKSAQAQLIQSEKMASLGELTAGIAHEIQNPLNFVNNFSEVNKELLVEMKDEMSKGNLEDATAIANDVIDNEEKINYHGKRADNIVKGMLQHSRSGAGQKEPTDINALADEYLRLANHGFRAKDNTFNATIKTDFDENADNINIVPRDIGRVLLNLYNNAFYAVSGKKKTAGEGYEPSVSVTTKKEGDKVEIKVADNGNGVPQKIIDKIFQPFFTTKPTGQGTGLGLSLSYDIIKAHGGEIIVESKEGEFTEFVIQLPVSV